MPNELERLLVVAFKYPPYAAVGGKRWAKLSKYLARQGVTVDVVTVPWPNGDPATLADVTHDNIRIHRIPAMSPNRLRITDPRTLLQRVRGKLYRTLVAGRPVSQDAAWWGPVVIPAVAWIARRKRSQAIVVTGAPFMANYWIARGKALLPKVPLVQEFRDPWADLPEASLRSSGTVERVAALERAVVRSADAVVTVTGGLTRLLGSTYPPAHCVTVPNGFDPEEFSPASSETDHFRLVHGGNLYVGRDEPLRALLAVVSKHARELPGLELVFLGGFPDAVRSEFRTLEAHGILRIMPRVSTADYAREVATSFATLQFNAEHFPYLVSTKIYEYAAAKKPVLSLNYGGEIDALIREHALGWSVDARDEREILDALRESHTLWKTEPGYQSEPVDFEQYDYRQIVDRYRLVLESLL